MHRRTWATRAAPAALAPAITLFAIVAVPVASAASVLVVDAAGAPGAEFASLGDAVAAAGEGDALLLRTGPFLQPVEVNGKSLVIAADEGFEPLVARLTIRGIAAGQFVALRGLFLVQAEGAPGLEIRDSTGPVWVEDCRIGFGTNSFLPIGAVAPALRAENAARVVLARVVARGSVAPGAFYNGNGGAAAELLGSGLHSYSCSFEGGAGNSLPSGGAQIGAGGAGLRVDGGFAFLSGSALTGGVGGNGVFIGGPQVCKPGGNGGDGLRALGGALVRPLDSAFAAGSGGAAAPSGGCGSGASGLAIAAAGATVTPLAGTATEFSISSPEREGTAHDFAFAGPPGADIVLLAAISPQAQFSGPALGSVLVLPPLVAIPFGQLPASGALTLAVPAGALPAGSEGLAAFVQPLYFMGGQAQLGAGTAVLLLDSSL